MPSGEDVQVEVAYGLAAVRAGVEDEAVAVGEFFLAGDVGGGGEEVAEDLAVLGRGVRVRDDVAFGGEQQVYGRLGIDVGEAEGVFVLVDASDGDLIADDLAEEAVGGHGFIP